MDIEQIQKLVGNADPEQLRHIDCFLSDNMGVFIPVSGPCYYAQQPMHTHPGYMVIIASDEFSKVQLDNSVIKSMSGKMLVMSPGVMHSELPPEDVPRYIALMIKKEFFESILLEHYAKDIPFIKCGFYSVPQSLAGIVRKFMLEYSNKSVGYKQMLNLLAGEAVHTILRAVYGVSLPNATLDYRIEINKLIEYMHTNMSEVLGIKDMIHFSGMSKATLMRVFKSETGWSPMEYLNNIRLERARKMLIAGDSSISEIAHACGYNSPSYLSSSFKKKFGYAPSFYTQKVGGDKN